MYSQAMQILHTEPLWQARENELRDRRKSLEIALFLMRGTEHAAVVREAKHTVDAEIAAHQAEVIERAQQYLIAALSIEEYSSIIAEAIKDLPAIKLWTRAESKHVRLYHERGERGTFIALRRGAGMENLHSAPRSRCSMVYSDLREAERIAREALHQYSAEQLRRR